MALLSQKPHQVNLLALLGKVSHILVGSWVREVTYSLPYGCERMLDILPVGHAKATLDREEVFY